MTDNVCINVRKSIFEEGEVTCCCFLHPWHPFKRLERVAFFIFNSACIAVFTALLVRDGIEPIWVLVVTVACTTVLNAVFRYFLIQEKQCCCSNALLQNRFYCSNELFLVCSTIVCIILVTVGFFVGVSSAEYIAYLVTVVASFFIMWLKEICYRLCLAFCPSIPFLYKNFLDQKKHFEEKYGRGVVNLDHFEGDIKDIPPIHQRFWEKTFCQNPYTVECCKWTAEEHRYWGTSLSFVLKSMWNLLAPKHSLALPPTWRDDIPKDFKWPSSEAQAVVQMEESKKERRPADSPHIGSIASA